MGKSRKCEVCSKEVRNLVEHRKVHSKNRPYVCIVCGAKFKRGSHLTAHNLTHSEIRPLFQCHICKKLFRQKAFRKKHIEEVHERLYQYSCVFCGKKCFSLFHYHDHILRHIEEKPISCRFNGCDQAFVSSSEIANHYRSHGNEKRFECEICERKFVQPHQLRKHQASFHPQFYPTKLSFKCNMCEKAFPNKTRLKFHMLSHSDTRPFDCKTCGKEFKTSKNLTEHANRIHDIDSRKEYKCYLCEKTFNIKSSMEGHLQRVHTKELIFKCNICEKRFLTRNQMNHHLTVYHFRAPKNHSCSLCNARFIFKHYLTGHIKRCHTLTVARFGCTLCERSFKTRPELQQHEKCVHSSQEKLHWCLFCLERFHSKHNLFDHLHTHIQEKPYPCWICTDSFGSSSHRATHVRRTHNFEGRCIAP